MALDLTLGSPLDLVVEPDLDELGAAIDAIPKWTRRHAEVVDFVWRERMLRLLVRRHTRAEVEELYDHIRNSVARRRTEEVEALGDHFPARWDGYARLLDARLETLSAPAGERDEIRRRAHVEPILRRVAEARGDGIEQTELMTLGGRSLRKANVTRILNLMEAAGLVERHRKGRKNFVRLGAGVVVDVAPARDRFIAAFSLPPRPVRA